MKIQEIENSVVVPWDYSEMSIDALRKAQALVDPSKIHVVHVTEYPSAYEYGIVWDMVDQDAIIKRLDEAFQEVVDEHSDLQAADFTVLFGVPGTKVAQFAEEKQADLILMASHGRKGFSRMLLGSVAERILRTAGCPVLILRDKADESDSPSESGSSVVMA